jgi:MFS transporter, DHA3 family, macrolide efflux protein
MVVEARHSESRPEGSVYLRVLCNRTLLLLWSGQSVSIVGDNFFNLAVMWVIYTQSHSVLQTSFIQVVWHLDRIIFGPLAGIFADRWDRKLIMVLTNVLSAVVVGALAAVMLARGQAPSAIISVAVFLLNGLITFFGPAQASLMPEVVGRDLLATAGGLFTTVGNVASLAGSALAGVVVAAMGAAWAVVGDAVSFLVAALSIAVARLPARTIQIYSSPDEKRPSFLREIRDGWRAIAGQPVMRAMVWLSLLINVASFLGPLYPALVGQRLHGNAATLGAIEAAGVIGGMGGGALAGAMERRLGAGHLLAAGWVLAGIGTLGLATSTWLPLTAALEAAVTFGVTVGSVSVGALVQALVPENYRGRVWGITGSVAVMSIPLSALIGGWLADILGVAPLFGAGGAFILGVAALAWSNQHVRMARI